jgi:hypothetical protein
MLAARCLVALSIAAACAAPSDPWPEVLQLARIKRLMQSHLLRIANFTCLETVERSRSDPAGRMKITDTLRLEVAFVNGKELYSWLGAGKFEESDIAAFTKGGAIGSGLFASHARNIFLQRWPTFHYAGVDTLHGRRAVRYNYEVPLLGSGYQLTVGGQRVAVGFSGSFWADAETLQVMRLTLRADDPPIHLGVSEALQSIDYGRVRLNDSDFLLPQSAETTLVYLGGDRRRNRTEFSHWQQYVGESTLLLDDAPASPGRADTVVDLHAGLVLSTRLETEIRSDKALVGDRITATVDQEARWKGKLVVPAGATLAGRIRSIEKPAGPSGSHTLGLEFFELRMGSRRARFFAQSAGVKSSSGAHKTAGGGLPGIVMLQIHGSPFRLFRELRMTWKMGDL